MSWADRLLRLLETSTFRHASLVAYIFLLVAVATVLISGRQTEGLLYGHVRDMVQSEMQTMDRSLLLTRSDRLARVLAEEAPREREGRLALVVAADGRVLYGDTAVRLALATPMAHRSPWRDLTTVDGEGHPMQLYGLQIRLADGGLYFSGYDVLPMLERVRVIPLVAGSGLLAVLITSLAIGLYSSVRSMRRVDRIRFALRRYVAGDRDAKVPVCAVGDEFDLLGSDVNRMLERINHLMDEVKSVSGHLAHELRTPLTRLHTRLVGAAELSDDTVRDEILAAVDEAERIQRLFKAVLRIGEIEAGRCPHSFTWFEARGLLVDVADYYQPLVDAEGIELRIETSNERQLYGDRALLFQALANLLENAIKYAVGASVITLLVSAGGNAVEVGVADDGPGIAQDERAEAVKRFRRLAHGSRPGYGLGLALVGAIAKLHGGELVLGDRPPRGLLAVIRLAVERCSEKQGRVGALVRG